MSLISRLSHPSHWGNRIVFVLTLLTLEVLTLGLIGIVMPLWTEESCPSIGEFVTITFWCLLVAIVLIDERRQPNCAMIATGVLPSSQTPKLVLRGTLWAVAMLTPVAVTGIVLGGEFRVAPIDVQPLILLSIIIASIGEEVLFRSTLLRVLKGRFGSGWAILITSILFSLAHSGNPSASMISSVNTFLIALAFGTVISLGGSIWLAAACHAAWNLIVALIFGPVSGHNAGISWIRFFPSDSSSLSPLLMGDAYGVESGLLCTVVISISLVTIRHVVTVDPFVIAARYRVAFNPGRSGVKPITAMESTNVA